MFLLWPMKLSRHRLTASRLFDLGLVRTLGSQTALKAVKPLASKTISMTFVLIPHQRGLHVSLNIHIRIVRYV